VENQHDHHSICHYILYIRVNVVDDSMLAAAVVSGWHQHAHLLNTLIPLGLASMHHPKLPLMLKDLTRP
jgi:hypothetical protein